MLGNNKISDVTRYLVVLNTESISKLRTLRTMVSYRSLESGQ